MEPVLALFSSYPTFLWITWCKILFIVSDQIWKTLFNDAAAKCRPLKTFYKSEYCQSYPQQTTLSFRREQIAFTF